jgi:hypothetical protein
MKWQIKIRTRAVSKVVKVARVVNIKVASSPDKVDSRAAVVSRNPANSSRSPDAKAASKVAKAVSAESP